MTKQFLVDVDESGKIVGTPKEFTGENTKTTTVEVKKFIPYQTSAYVYLGGGLFIFLLAIWLSVFVVKQQTVKIIERLGKYKKIATPGINFKIPFLDKIVKTMDMKTQQLQITVETKTKDNVFTQIRVAVQYFVVSTKVYDAFYRLDKPQEQITAYILDAVRSKIPTLSLDETFEKKDDIARHVTEQLKQTMDDFGYSIVTALVVDIDPDAQVKESMNNINAAQRNRVAATEKGEAEKILIIKNAEAEAESKRLQGIGIAGQRLAIAEGLKKSTEELKNVTGLDGGEIMTTIMLTQYFDTLKDIGTGGKVIFLNSSPSGLGQISDEIKRSIIGANEVK